MPTMAFTPLILEIVMIASIAAFVVALLIFVAVISVILMVRKWP